MHKNTFYKPTANVLLKVSSIKYEVCNMWSFFVCFVEVNQAIKRLLTSFLLDKCVIKMSTNVSGEKNNADTGSQTHDRPLVANHWNLEK